MALRLVTGPYKAHIRATMVAPAASRVGHSAEGCVLNPQIELTSGGAVFARLHKLGIDVVFANSGTDFPPIIEGLAEADAHEVPLPRAILVPHEHVAMGMAHGYWFATGRPQAVMLHTNVGLANGSIGAINAAADHVPMILMSGRTPTVEQGRFGARTVPIGWGQEMRDQTALVREAVKWDYELRFPEQVGEVLDRAHAIAASTPAGPTYVMLPREILCEPCPPDVVAADVAMQPSRIVAHPDDLALAAQVLASAERPLIVAQRGAGSEAGFGALAKLAEQWAIPVCQYWAVATAVSADHPCNIGVAPSPWIDEADVVLVIDCLAPWMPDAHGPPTDAQVIQLGPNPLYSRFPVRNFKTDLAITTEVGPALVALEAALADVEQTPATADAVSTRRTRINEYTSDRRAALAATAAEGGEGAMTKAFVASCIAKAIAGHTSTVVSELGAPMEHLAPIGHNSWRQEPHSGGLGWGLPCAMGIKLAEPDRLAVAVIGDGSYIFANPVACHQVAESAGIAVLAVVVNNRGYAAVRNSVLGLYPTGYASKGEDVPLTDLTSPDFVKIAEAGGAYAVRVDDPAALPDALEQAVQAVTVHGQQAVVEVAVAD